MHLGGSVIEVAEKLRKMGANKICITCTFALFTEGFDKFLKAKNDGLFDTLYTTNLSYIPKEITDNEWFYDVDMTPLLAEIIDCMDKKEPLTKFFNKTKETFTTVQKSMNT